MDYGIPRRFINVEYWEVEPEIPLGAGNPTMEMARAKQLLEMRPMFDGTAQQEILHEATVVFTDDPKKADRWVPIDKKRAVSTGQEHAELAFSTIMLGAPVQPVEGLSFVDQISTLLGMIAAVISRIEKTGNMARPDEIIGLQNAEKYTADLIAKLGEDQAEKPRAKQFSDILGKLMNAVKGFQQRLQQAQEAAAKAQQEQQNGNGHDPRVDAQIKAQAAQLTATTKAQIADRSAQLKERHKQISFQNEQKRRDAEAFAEIQREGAKTHEELQRKRFAAFDADSE
jgi:hypothetical protein